MHGTLLLHNSNRVLLAVYMRIARCQQKVRGHCEYEGISFFTYPVVTTLQLL